MKTCPICNARCFDDMELCYGCLHDFTKQSDFSPTSACDSSHLAQDWDIEECPDSKNPFSQELRAKEDGGVFGFSPKRSISPFSSERKCASGQELLFAASGESGDETTKGKSGVTVRIEFDPLPAFAGCGARSGYGSFSHALGIPMMTVVGNRNGERGSCADGNNVKEGAAEKGEASKNGCEEVGLSREMYLNEGGLVSGEGGVASDADCLSGKGQGVCRVTVSVA